MSKLKRLNAPKSWKITRKTHKYAVNPMPGSYKKEESLPLAIIIRDNLKIAENIAEVRQLLNRHQIKVNQKIADNHRLPVGLMDIVSIDNDNYRIMPSSHGLKLQKVNSDEAAVKLIKIVNKTSISGKKTQLNFHDGRNIIVDKDVYKTGDVLVFDLLTKKEKQHLQFKRGATVLIISGKNSGKVACVEDVIMVRSSQPNKVVLKIGNEKIETLRDYTFVIGHEKSAIIVNPMDNPD